MHCHCYIAIVSNDIHVYSNNLLSLAEKLDGNMYIYGGGVTRCCYFSYVFFSLKKIKEDEVEDSSEIEMSIVNKSTPLIHEILFFFFFIEIRTTIRYAIRAHIHTRVCVCVLGIFIFSICNSSVQTVHFISFICVCMWKALFIVICI